MPADPDAVHPRTGRLCVRGSGLLVVADKVAGAVSHQVSVCTCLRASLGQRNAQHSLEDRKSIAVST